MVTSQKTVKQVQSSDTATDRESTQSDTEFEEDTPSKEDRKHTSRKVKGILKNKIRKTKSKKSENSDQIDKDLTRSASASNLAALDVSELCATDSSEDEEEEIN